MKSKIAFYKNQKYYCKHELASVFYDFLLLFQNITLIRKCKIYHKEKQNSYLDWKA